MKNWVIVLLIFIMPLCIYAYFDAKAQNDKMCKLEGNVDVKNPKAKIIKFYSPMCSECKDTNIEMQKAMKELKDSVVVQEVNVIEQSEKGPDCNKEVIKKYKVTLVPTLVFLDKTGKLVKKQEGLMKSEEIMQTLNGIK